MNKKFYAVIFLMLIIVSFVVQATTNKSSGSILQNSETQKTTLQKWEYCVIGYSGGEDYNPVTGNNTRFFTAIHFYTNAGIKEEKVEGKNSIDSRVKAIAKLGDEGWEIVTMNDTIHFKRPKQ